MYTPISTEDRNRAHLIKALAAGITIRPAHTAHTWYVSSVSEPGKDHLVERYILNGTRYEYCNCQWGQKHEPFTVGSRPCVHVLRLRWELLDADGKAAVLDIDPEIAAVLAAGPVPVAA